MAGRLSTRSPLEIGRAYRRISAATVLFPVEIAPFSRRAVLWLLGHPLTLNLLSFFVLSLLAFRKNNSYLFFGLDGQFEVSLIALGSSFTVPEFGYTNDFIHGLGNIWFTVNPWFILEYFLSLSGDGSFNDFPLAYTLSASELFLAIFLTGRLIGVDRYASLVAAWLVPLLTFQYAGWSLIGSTYSGFPHYASMSGVTTLVAVMLLLLGQLPRLGAALAAALAFLGISYIVIVAPTLLILGAPMLVVAGLVSVVAARDGPHFMLRIALMAAILAISVGCGYASFIFGLIADSAAAFFPNLSIRPGRLAYVSLLFASRPFPVFFTVERTFILLGLLGGAWTVLRAQGTLFLAALVFLATALGYLAIGIVNSPHPVWPGPAFTYFEGFLLPFHGIFAVVLLSTPVRLAARLAPSLQPFARICYSPVTALLLGIAIAAAPWFYVHQRQKVSEPLNTTYYGSYPQRETAITRILKDQIALHPGAVFRGRAATLTGRIFPLSTNVSFVTLSNIPDKLAMQTTGNYNSFAGLWQDAIPTLAEYNQLMTPAYFAFGRTFFTEPADVQIRNIIAMRRIDPRMLRVAGARFFVTDAPFNGDARLRETLPVPVTPEMLINSGIAAHISSFALYLYELDRANLGQYSPTEIRHAETANETLDILADPAVDLSQTVVTSANLPNDLVPAALGSFIIDQGLFRLKAASEGWSLLVLPMEYSRCLHLDKQSDAAGAHLIRVDLLMTGVLFNRKLDARLTYRSGPLIGSYCRIEDARDMKAIKIQEAFTHRPELAPVRIKSY